MDTNNFVLRSIRTIALGEQINAVSIPSSLIKRNFREYLRRMERGHHPHNGEIGASGDEDVLDEVERYLGFEVGTKSISSVLPAEDTPIPSAHVVCPFDRSANLW
ncbi:hypothetical protein [Natrinema gelatinilyticum]|uniref:hypothetical protein n=1 Tax=Natrinema gelatinilyticum TaxID=2961571 RepID=UPI0020C229B1|nr:hypothetical protein [Natrinema gelatinilyticum]